MVFSATTIRPHQSTTPTINCTLFVTDASGTSANEPSLFSSADGLLAESAPVDGPSSSTGAKHDDPFSYDSQMMFDRAIAPSLSAYQAPIGYTPRELRGTACDYPVHQNTSNSLADMLASSASLTTVTPLVTSGLSDEDVSAYNLGAGIAGLSISSPTSSPFFRTESIGSSSALIPISQPQPTLVCDPKMLNSPIVIEQSAVQAEVSMQSGGSRRSSASSYHAPAVDSDYSPSGESEVEDENDYDYGIPSNKRKGRSNRVSQAAHPYFQPAPKAKSSKRGTKLEIPTPVPGLTKNSRGRAVPRRRDEDGSRTFWCSVQDCDKMFSRGEHLKRHIMSIHTYSKREPSFLLWYRLVLMAWSVRLAFQCECKNEFSRRDNLFQHMRAKGCVVWYCDGKLQHPIDGVQEAEVAEDPLVAQIMADAAAARKKRAKASKQAWARA